MTSAASSSVSFMGAPLPAFAARKQARPKAKEEKPTPFILYMRLCRIPSCYPSIEKPNAATHRNGHVSITTGTPIWFATGVYMSTSDSGVSMLTISEYRACFSHAPRCGRLFHHPIVGNKIGKAHVRTHTTNAHLGIRHLI